MSTRLNMKIAVGVKNLSPLADDGQGHLICKALTAAGYHCDVFMTCADWQMQTECPQGESLLHCDMLILSWQVNALEILRWSREKLPAHLPILLMVSDCNEDDVVAGLAAGANEYMMMPIRRKELLLRVDILLRRAYPAHGNMGTFQFSHYAFDTRTTRITINGQAVVLTRKEFDLALLFFNNIDRPLSRAFIHETIWTNDIDIPSRTMDTHVSRVRNKLQLLPENGFQLTPVYSYGYCLEQKLCKA